MTIFITHKEQNIRKRWKQKTKCSKQMCSSDYLGKLNNKGRFIIPEYQRGYIRGQHSRNHEGIDFATMMKRGIVSYSRTKKRVCHFEVNAKSWTKNFWGSSCIYTTLKKKRKKSSAFMIQVPVWLSWWNVFMFVTIFCIFCMAYMRNMKSPFFSW